MADKKITELPFITDVTASVGTAPANTTVIPVVLYGTTNQITADNLKDNFIREVRATVAGVQTYTSSLKGAVTVRGNGIEVAGNLEIGGNVSVKGTLHTQYETSSIIYSSGSTKFGNSFDDLHEFTGSIYFTGSHTINGEDYTYYSSSNSAVFTDFSSSNSNAITSFSSSNSTLYTNFSSSNSTLFTNFSSSNSSYNTTFSSSNASYITALSSSNSTYNTTFSSSNASYVTALSSSNSSYNTNLSSSNSTLFTNFSSSNSSYNTNLSSSNSTLFTNFSSSNSTLFTNFSSSNSSYNTTFSSSNSTLFTNFSSSNSSYNTTFSSSNSTTFTNFSSSNSTTFTNYSSSTANSIAGLSSGVSSELARVYQTTSSLNIFTGSQDSRNFVISQFTSSTDAHIVGIATYTSSLEAQLRRVYQTTSSLNIFTGSQDSRNFVISQFTSSTNNSIVGVSAFTSSQLAVNLGNSIFTSSARIELNSIEAYTASLKTAAIVSSSTQVQNYDVFALNSNLYTSTGSLIGITNGLMALTASMKAQAIVSSSTQISNYYKFAETASASTTFYGNIIGTANVQANKFVFTDGVVNTNVGGQKILATNTNILYLYSGTSGIYINNQANDTTIAQFTNAGQLTIGGPGNDQNLVFGGTNSSIYWGVGGPARMYYNIGDIRISSNGAADVLNVKNIGGILVDGGITGSLMATNGVVSGSSQILELTQIAGIEAYTASLKNAFSIDSSNDVYFNGKITAQEIHTTYTTSSVLYQSGSSKFGNDSTDKHEFTGSIKVTGSFEVQGTGTDATIGDLWVDSANKTVYVGRQSATSGNNSLFIVRNRLNTVNALYVDAGGNGAVNVTGSFDVTRGVKLATATGTVSTPGNVLFGIDNTNKHEVTGSLNTSFGNNGGLFVNDGFQKTFTFATGNLFSIDFGSAEGGGFVDITYGGVISTIGGRGGATRYAISYKDATNAVATKVHAYGDDIVSASISATKVAIFSIAGNSVQSAKYQVNVSVNAVAADGSGNYDKILYNRL